MQKWRGMHKGLSDAPKRSKYRVRKGWHRILFENSAKHPANGCGKESPKDGRTYRTVEEAEDSPSRIPFNRKFGARHHYRIGWFSKFLKSRVGRSWNSVYSEIRQNLDYRNGAQGKTLHLLLSWKVETHCWIDEDGIVYCHFAGGCYPLWNNTFYVHPETGILMYSGSIDGEAQRRRHAKYAYEKDFYGKKIPDPSDENNFLQKDEFTGMWFAVRREEHKEEGMGDNGIRYCYIEYRHHRLQLSKCELKTCGLENEFMEFMEPAPLV